MKIQSTLARNAHFLGSKIRGLRKQSGLTLEDLSVRCIQIDAHTAPSISYFYPSLKQENESPLKIC